MKIQIFETVQCEWCGMECFDDDLKDGKCQECIVEDCRHSSTWTDYVSSNSERAKFTEHCTHCNSWRIYRFYFNKKTARIVGPWRTDEVDV